MTMPAATITERYRSRTPRAAALAGEAKRWLPGGDTRTTTWYPPYPIFAAGGSGAYLEDVDGNRYLDLLGNYTSQIHGHAHPVLMDAIRAQLERGTSFAAPHEHQVRLARMLCERVEAVESVRFTNSGTEAVLMALRLARATTGRPLIAKVEGGYHGTFDDVQVSIAPPVAEAGPVERPLPIPDSPGLRPGALESTIVVPFNDLEATTALLEPLGDRLAAVIVEAVNGVGGIVPAQQEYLEGLRELTRRLGTLLVIDEIITFRLSTGGAQALYGVVPDLVTFGKIIGGGLAVGAFGGRRGLMELFDPSRDGSIPHGGTFNANPATMAGGIAGLELLTPDEIERLNGLGERLRDRINALGDELGLAVRATGVGSLVNIHLVAGEIHRYRDGVGAADPERARLLHLGMLNEGLFMARRGLMAVSTPMSAATIDEALEGIRRAVAAVHAEAPLPELARA
jgi:glutamate-1-semialdehyde 2,1-aminomutase